MWWRGERRHADADGEAIAADTNTGGDSCHVAGGLAIRIPRRIAGCKPLTSSRRKINYPR